MSRNIEAKIRGICQDNENDRTRLMDIVRSVQEEFGCVSSAAMDLIAKHVSTHRVEVEGVVSFYSFLSEKPKGKITIRLCNDVADRMLGVEKIAEAFSKELGIGIGETTEDGSISLEYTACIGMSDQAPAALINDEVVTSLTRDRVPEIVKLLRDHGGDTKELVQRLGDGNNAHPLVSSMVENNIRMKGEVLFGESVPNDGLKKALAMTPAEVIRDVKTARLRGRGGAGFPTGMKWDFTRKASGDRKCIVCNADEGEPGTFKDRVLLTETPDLLFEGMTIAAYAIGADTGIIYLRGEYAYLREFLESRLEQRRKDGLLGNNICGEEDFSFDIRIQMGAGAYICGEETALLSSCEGLRGDPKNRPPFPAQKGYLGMPTAVNNVETLCCVTRILEKGPGWFAGFGSDHSPGTKLISVSGDCKSPGVYEVQLGTTLDEFLKMIGAEDAIAVQVGGPSGQMVGPSEYNRTICYEDLATGGSLMVFGPSRDILWVVAQFMEFFIEESCGYCTPCRVGNVLLKKKLDQILAGKGEPADLEYLQDLGKTVKAASRCGLGQTSPNPIASTLKNFRPLYEGLVAEEKDGFQPSFDIKAALAESVRLTGRNSVHFK
jgi:[NiFe] hydrogenase diaphorase moiety large subunit